MAWGVGVRVCVGEGVIVGVEVFRVGDGVRLGSVIVAVGVNDDLGGGVLGVIEGPGCSRQP